MLTLKEPYIIAEIGSNWRNREIGKLQIARAAACGASAVKFQMYSHKELYGVDGELPFELSFEDAIYLERITRQHNIDFLCTAFSVDGYHQINKLVNMHKIASCEASDPLIMETVKGFNLPFLVSNGGDKEHFLVGDRAIPLECVGKYPATLSDYRLKKISRFPVWGISDHTLTGDLAVLAFGMGAMIFEKHVDFCPEEEPTPDSCVSIKPIEFAKYVDLIQTSFHVACGDLIEKENIVSKFKRRYDEELKGYYRPRHHLTNGENNLA